MSKQIKLVLEASKPIYFLSRIAATVAIKKNKSGELHKSHLQGVLSVIYFIIFSIPAFIYYEKILHFTQTIEVSIIIAGASKAYLTLSITSLITATILTNCYSHTIVSIIERLANVDKQLENFNVRTTLLQSNYSLWKDTVLSSVVYFLFVFPLVLLGFNFNINSAVVVLNLAVVLLVNFSTKLQYYFATRLFYFRFKVLNDLLKAFVVDSKRIAKYPLVEEAFHKSIKEISNIHRELVKAARLVNSSYSFCLLFHVLLYLLGLLDLIYFVTFKFITIIDLNKSMILLFINYLIILVYNLIELYVLIRSTSLMCYEVSICLIVFLCI